MEKPIPWKELGIDAAKEAGRVVLNVVAMFGALALFGAYTGSKAVKE